MTSLRIRFFALSVLGLHSSRAAPSLSPRSLGRVRADKEYLSSSEAIATYSPSDFTPDGDLSKAVWKQAKWVEFDHDPTGKTENPSIKTRRGGGLE